MILYGYTRFTLLTDDDNFLQDAGIKLSIESHGGEDVAIYANGPFAHLFHALHEQNYIPVAIDYAACYRKQDAPHCTAGASSVVFSYYLFLVIINVMVKVFTL